MFVIMLAVALQFVKHVIILQPAHVQAECKAIHSLNVDLTKNVCLN